MVFVRMKKAGFLAKSLLAVASMVLWTPAAFAFNSVSSAAFHPYTAGDVNYIQHEVTYVYNSDPNVAHHTIADLGVANYGANSVLSPFVQVGVPTAGAITCWTTAVRTNSSLGNTYQGTITFPYGQAYNYHAFAVPLTIPVAGQYAVTMTCLLPYATGSGWKIYGVYQ